MAVPPILTGHTLRTYRLSPNIAGYLIDDYPSETTDVNVPTGNLEPFLMSFGSGNQFIADWVRVRAYCGTEAVASVASRSRVRWKAHDPGEERRHLILSGSTANFSITVSNVGDFDLSNVVVSDPLAPDCERTIGTFPIGAVETYTCTLANVTTDLTNSATASGEAPGGVPVSATDSHFVDVIQRASPSRSPRIPRRYSPA